MRCSFYSTILFVIIMLPMVSNGQITIAFQGGEGTPADNWSFAAITNAGGPTPPGAVTTNPRTGSFSIRAGGGTNVGCSSGANCISGGGAAGCAMHGNAIEFSPVNVSCLSGVQVSCFHSSHAFCSGDGFDSGERLIFEVSLNGGPWNIVAQVGGFGDYTWNYSTNPAGNPSSGYPLVPNPFVYNVPAGTNLFAFRVRGNVNRSDEVFYIDEVKLTTTTTGYGFPGTAGLWTGKVSTDWNNPCNWENRTVPVAATNVLIPLGALNDCEVFSSSAGTCNNLVADRKLTAQYASSVLNVNGNLTISPNGELDMSLSPMEGGTLNLAGNWLNQRDETFFQEQASTVNFTGGSIQILSVTNDTKESFYKLNLNKSGNQLRLSDDVWIDPSNTGGVTPMLRFLGGDLLLNNHEMLVYNPAPAAVQRISGGVISERTDNGSRFTWKIGPGAGSYIIPFISTTGVYIPFIWSPVSGSTNDLTVSTYGTGPDNLPWPVTPANVTNLASTIGLSPDNRDATVDRFWNINSTGTPVANLTFSYTASELPIAPFNDPFTMKAQRYETSSNYWMPFSAGQNSTTYSVTAALLNSFGTYTLSNILSPLPVTWLDFTATRQQKTSLLKWSTASELNSSHFTVERSADGNKFDDLAVIDAAGNSTDIRSYTQTDRNPFTGITYYRIRQTDFDGRYSFSPVRAVRHAGKDEAPVFFPSVATNCIYVHSGTETELIIREVSGKVVLNLKLDRHNEPQQVDISALAAGIYLVTFPGKSTGRLVVQK